MPDLPDLYATPVRLALLADVASMHVADDEDGTPMLDCGDGTTARVADAIWAFERAGWVEQPADILGWRITNLGRTVLEAGTL
jgi:hypothetical protein